MSFTNKQITSVVGKLFIKYDRDEDGFLDGNEITVIFNKALRSLNQAEMSEREVERSLKKFDKNRDSKIDMREMKALLLSIDSNSNRIQ
jgi:Ca2+-binding EF-hand superfamily protein